MIIVTAPREYFAMSPENPFSHLIEKILVNKAEAVGYNGDALSFAALVQNMASAIIQDEATAEKQVLSTEIERDWLGRQDIIDIVGAGGDIENLPLFLEIDPEAIHHDDVTWAEFAASINHIPTEIDGAFYMEATDGQINLPASEVIALGLTWFTTAEFIALNA